MSKTFASLTSSSCCIAVCVSATAVPPGLVRSHLRLVRSHLRQRFHHGREARPVGGARRLLPQLLQLLARAVAPHPDVMDDAVGLFLTVPELVLLAAAQVDLVVGELAAGERRAVGRG